jgi:hypothetical protein
MLDRACTSDKATLAARSSCVAKMFRTKTRAATVAWASEATLGQRVPLQFICACEVICLNSDFQKSCQARNQEIFRLTARPNQSHNSARLTADEGRWPSSRTRGEMRWTRELQLTCVAQAYGKVVWESSGGEGECRRCHAADRGHCRATRKALADRIPPRMQRATSRLFLPFMHATYCRRCTGTVSEMMTWRPTTL